MGLSNAMYTMFMNFIREACDFLGICRGRMGAKACEYRTEVEGKICSQNALSAQKTEGRRAAVLQ